MKIAVVTSLNKRLFDEYGHNFYDTYNWKGFDLYTYTEDADWIAPKGATINLFDQVPECKEFVERTPPDKKREVRYDPDSGRRMAEFRLDAVRFCYKVYGYTNLILNNRGYDGVIYTDADCVFYKPIDARWAKKQLHRDDCMMTYLGRIGKWSECGFLYFNCKHPKTVEWAQRLHDVYTTDEIFDLQEWHDSYVVDQVRIEFEKEHGVKNHNIGWTSKNPNHLRFQRKTASHVQAWSVLGEIYDHCKGARKGDMKSPENIHI